MDPSKLYVEVVGDLKTDNGRQIVDQSRQTYGLTFSRHGSMVRLSSIVPVNKDEAKGSKAPVSNKGEPL